MISLSPRRTETMSLESWRPKPRKEDSGVSEVVGNIMILMITVVLFSSIIAFVQQMPVPEQATKADFSASVTFWSGGTKANLTVTHAGGAVMRAAVTTVMVEVDEIADVYNMSSSTHGLYDPATGLKGTGSWKTGMSWMLVLENTSYTSKIVVTVIDMSNHMMVWTSQVSGGTGGNPPMILQRYTDSNWSTPTPDPVKEWDDFTLFVTITDPDGDLDTAGTSIWIDASTIADVDFSGGYDGSSGSVYWWNFTGIWDSQVNVTDLDGKVIYIHAKDLAAHESISTYVMTVTQIPTNTIINPADIPTEESGGLPSYLTNFWKRRAGYGVYPELFNGSRALGVADTNNPTTVFQVDDLVFIRFASTEINNVEGLNEVELKDVRTGNDAVIQFNGSSTEDAPFYRLTTVGSASVFECQFSTANLWPTAFTFFFYLAPEQEAGQLQEAYDDKVMIFVNLDNSTITWVPEMTLYKDGTWSSVWGARTTPYEVSSGDSCKIYVQIEVLNTDNPPAPNVAEIRITDMTGSSELYGVPPAGSMMSSMYRLNGTVYWFWIDLRLNNGLQWAPGTNSYTVEISRFNDTNEGMYYLSKQVYIKGAGTRADFFLGTSGMASGNSNFNTREYAFYVQNNNLFSSRVLWLSESTPGSSTDYTVTAMASGDTDGDGDKDLLIAFASSNQLLFFENTLDTFGTWQSGSSVPRKDGITYRIVWIAFGDVNGDSREDFAYANSNNQIVIFNTTYGASGWIYSAPAAKGWTAPINKIALEDMTGDSRADLVVLASNKITIYDLKYSYDQYLRPYRDTEGKERWKYSTGTTVDMDIADMNYDGHLDILAADTTAAAWAGSANSVNVNYYTESLGTPYTIDTGAPGYTPAVGAGSYSGFTNLNVADGNVMTVYENTLVEAAPHGWLNITMKTNTLPNSPDIQLRLRARISGTEGGTPVESFYVQYSIDGLTFIPVIIIDDFSGSWEYYNYSLPGACMGKAIYIRFTDSRSNADSAAIREKLEVDLLAVYSDLFGGYTGNAVVTDASYIWRSVRAGDIDGGGGSRLEVVVARHHDTQAAYSGWKVYRHVSGTSWQAVTGSFSSDTAYPGTTLSFFYSSATKEENGYFTNLAPTVFDVVDINGDGYSDILATNYTSTTTYNTYIGFFMNLWTGNEPYWRYFSVKTWTIDPPVGQAKDPWVTIALVANLIPPA